MLGSERQDHTAVSICSL